MPMRTEPIDLITAAMPIVKRSQMADSQRLVWEMEEFILQHELELKRKKEEDDLAVARMYHQHVYGAKYMEIMTGKSSDKRFPEEYRFEELHPGLVTKPKLNPYRVFPWWRRICQS